MSDLHLILIGAVCFVAVWYLGRWSERRRERRRQVAEMDREGEHEFMQWPPDVRATVTIRRPVKFVATSGATRSNQDVMVPPLRCGCRACNPDAIRMFLCETCGNKRCPHATDHRLTCTGSNDPGQPGSVY